MGYYSGKLMGMQAEAVSGIVTDGLKLYLDASNPASYPGSGTTWFDLSGNGNNGTMVNGVVPLSNAMRFDGVDDYISTLMPLPSTTEHSISFMFNANNIASTQVMLGYYISGADLWVGTFGNKLGYFQSGNSIVSPENLIIGVDYIVACVKTTTNRYMYINGVLKATGSTYNDPTGNLTIGQFADAFNFNGKINDITIYSRSLTPEEVLHNFNATKSKYGL